MCDSILNSIKKVLGVSNEDDYFDADLIVHINSVFFTLRQLGVNFINNYYITDSTDTWSEYISNMNDCEAIKTYVCLKVRLLFDPPSNASLIDCINKQLSELEWRIMVALDRKE